MVAELSKEELFEIQCALDAGRRIKEDEPDYEFNREEAIQDLKDRKKFPQAYAYLDALEQASAYFREYQDSLIAGNYNFTIAVYNPNS